MFLSKLFKKLLKRKYFGGADISSGKDYSCVIERYIDKNGKIYITKQTFS